LILVVPVIAYIFLIGYCAKINTTNPQKQEIELATKRLSFLNNNLNRALQFLAIVVVLTGLTTSLIGNSIKATIQISAFDIFPPEMSYAYGLLFAFFLAIIYFPVSLYIKQQKSLVEEMLSENTSNDENWVKKMEKLLATKSTALENLSTAFTILSPLIASFLPEHLQNFK
jgi:hypothetical protein